MRRIIIEVRISVDNDIGMFIRFFVEYEIRDFFIGFDIVLKGLEESFVEISMKKSF